MHQPPAMIDGADCVLCHGRGTAFMRRDKHGRPYMKCSGCGSTIFTGSPIAAETLLWLCQNGKSYYPAAAAAMHVPSEKTA